MTLLTDFRLNFVFKILADSNSLFPISLRLRWSRSSESSPRPRAKQKSDCGV